MEKKIEADAPFSERYALPAQVSANLGDMSWDTVVQLSCDYQAKTADKESKVKKVLRELQMTRLLLMDRIKESSESGKIDPRLLVDVVKLLQRCEAVTRQYDVDLKEFSNFLYLISEKLKKEKLARHEGELGMRRIVPMQEELSGFKARSERLPKYKKVAKGGSKKNGKGKNGKR